MSDAYKCDRCALVVGGYPALHIMVARTNRELCESCKADFTRWMNREPTSVLVPKDEDPRKEGPSNGPIGERIDWTNQAQRILNPERWPHE